MNCPRDARVHSARECSTIISSSFIRAQNSQLQLTADSGHNCQTVPTSRVTADQAAEPRTCVPISHDSFLSIPSFPSDIKQYSSSQNELDSLCVSPECARSAASIVGRMDLSVNPCDNFYDFACGRYLQTKTAPDDYSSRNILQEIQDEIYVEMKNYLERPTGSSELKSVRNLKLFYASCMNETNVNDEQLAVDIMVKFFDHSGGPWPALQSMAGQEEAEARTRATLEDRIASAFMNQVQSIFHFYVAPPDKNSTGYAFHLYNGNTVLEAVYLLNASLDYQKAYADFQVNVLKLLTEAKGWTISEDNLEKARQEVLATIAFEADLANITKSFAENSTVDEDEHLEAEDTSASRGRPQYVKMTIKQLDTEYGFINWTRIVTLFNQTNGQFIDEVLIDSKEFLTEISNLFARHSLDTIDNYFCWASIDRFMPYLGPRFRRTQTDFRREVPDLSSTGSEPRTESGRSFLSRWKECVHLTCEGMKLPASLLYMQHKGEHLQYANKSVTEMIGNIKHAFYDIIDRQSWLRKKETRQLLKERADKIGSKIGFPPFVQDTRGADKYYGSLDIASNDVFVSNIIKIARNEMVIELRKLNETVDPDKEWLIQPLVANAFFDATNDYIILPPGILRYPLVSPGRPKFLDYSTLGVVIGHEIAHSFDALARRENDVAGGNLTWWPSELNKEYETLTKCFVDQFSSYVIESTGDALNGNSTLDENLCDFSGFQQSFAAYKKLAESRSSYQQRLAGLTHFTTDQLFFIQYAQVWCEVSNEEGHRKSARDSHAPGRFRTIGVVVNSPQFGPAFNCPVDSPMNPSKKCKLWSPV
ncbi:Membrane metallo-endopeptidase-like 1 [Halotydeus destructor]|nr:Membrane metallo-endopeptidase-like 1 [Halotydeus destructor]